MSEIGGIIRNGLERGWPADEIKNSLLNSGYSEQDIDYEFSLLTKTVVAQQASVKQANDIPLAPSKVSENKFNPQDLSNYQAPPVEKKASNWMVIAIIALLVLCVLAGAGLFLFG